MLESYPVVTTLVASIIIAFLCGLVANRLKLPTILGYLVAGIIVGPNTPGFIANIAIAEQFAEVGVILLMFGVGLHFSTSDLKAVHRTALPGAILQMLITTFICMIVAIALNHDFIESFVFGVTLSIASTVVMLRALEENKIIETHIGKVAIGWLIVEDIAIVIFLVMLPVFSQVMLQGNKFSIPDILKLIITIAAKIIAFITIMVIFGKKLLPKLLISISKTKSDELSTLGIITISSGFAFIAYTIFGASFALGAFMAGFVLNESKIGRKIAQDSLPLRDIFTVLFFVSAGMLFNPKILIEEPALVLLAFILVTFGKAAITYFIAKFFKKSEEDCLVIAVSLAQIGEFSFILAALSLKLGIFSNAIYNMVIASAIISIAINPFLFKFIKNSFSKK